VTYSVGAPLDRLDAGTDFHAAYGDLALRGWRLSGAVVQGQAVVDAQRWLYALSRAGRPEADTLVEVCSESSATIAAHALSPAAEAGLYALVDLGAWTTEMCVVRLTDVGRAETGLPALVFPVARTWRVATNSIDERSRRNLLELYACQAPEPSLAERVRSWRERSELESQIEVGGRRYRVRPSALDFARDLVGEELRRRFVDVLAQARAEGRTQGLSELSNLTVLVSGGGWHEPVLYSGIGEHECVGRVDSVPRPTDLLGAVATDPVRLLAAYGLSFSSVLWPREIRPSEIPPHRPRVRHATSSEELGYAER
jgi:hypothetical protein